MLTIVYSNKVARLLKFSFGGRRNYIPLTFRDKLIILTVSPKLNWPMAIDRFLTFREIRLPIFTICQMKQAKQKGGPAEGGWTQDEPSYN